jgi:serine phosphatase RsbU (regulator of sigma subunit)
MVMNPGEPERPDGGLLTVRTPGAEESAGQATGADEKATSWSEPLQRLALALVRAVTLDDVAAALAAYGTGAAGAAWSHVCLLGDDGAVAVSLLGGPAVPSRRLDHLGLDAPCPWNDALRERQVVHHATTAALYRAYPGLARSLPLPSPGPVVTVPLTTVGQGCGAVTFGFEGPGVSDGDAPSGDDLQAIAAIAALAGHAAARAARYASEHQTVDALQRAYLPARLAPLAGLSFATRYLPADEPMAVGGDWYDAIPLPGHRVGVIIGDVAGHGLPAATVMASLRAALRAFATVDACPARILARLNDYTCLFKPDAFATVFIGVFEPGNEQLRYASAGHPPALLLTAAGPAQVLGGALGPPLGLPGARYESDEQAFPPGASLVAYTDGLIERRDQVIDTRLADLVKAASSNAGAGPDDLCDRLVFELLAGRDLFDDAALLVTTRRPNPS